jgi:hypothetical protein
MTRSKSVPPNFRYVFLAAPKLAVARNSTPGSLDFGKLQSNATSPTQPQHPLDRALRTKPSSSSLSKTVLENEHAQHTKEDASRYRQAEAAAGAAAPGYNTPDSLDYWQSKKQAITDKPGSAHTHIITGYTDCSTDSQMGSDSPAPYHGPFADTLKIVQRSSPLLQTAVEKKQTPHNKESASQPQQAEAAGAAPGHNTPDSLDYWQSKKQAITDKLGSAHTHIITGYTDCSMDNQTKLDSPIHSQHRFMGILNVGRGSPLLKAVLEKKQAQHDTEASAQQAQEAITIIARPNSAPPCLS